MKTLFAFYSFEGNCRALAGVMAEAVGADIFEIRPAKEIPRGAFMKYINGIGGSLRKKAPELAPGAPAVRDYALIVVGGPVWAGNMAPPVRSFLQGEDWRGMRLALFAMSRGFAGATFTAMREIVEQRGGTVVDTARFTDLRKGDAAVTRANAVAWCRGVLASRPENGTIHKD